MNYAIIGDIHSQGTLLAAALDHCKTHNLTPILLGDLFDSRCEVDETLYVWNLARLAQTEMGAIILNSNHQDRLLEVVAGWMEEAYYNEETFRSYRLFEDAGVTEQVAEWLMTLPDGFVFFDNDGLEHCCAHAYFPAKLRKPGATEPYEVFSEDEEMLQKMVWGPYNANGTRYHWWKNIPENQPFVRVAGHYHILKDTPRAKVLDTNAGYEGGVVPLYEVDAKNLVYFGSNGATIEQENLEVA